MIKVGITGGIGSGKTTFCKEWERLGAYVLYADDFAKELMVKDAEIIQNIKNTFGAEAYFEDGALNRNYLAEEAFAGGRVDELNSIVHPILWDRMDKLILQKEKEGVQVFLKEAAILLNEGRPDNLDYVILVKIPEKLQIERVQKRDETTAQKVRDRIGKQPDFQKLEHLCDFIVENSGTKEDLIVQARQIYKNINL